MSKQVDPANIREYAGQKLLERTTFKSPIWKWDGQNERFEKDPSKPDRDESLNPYLPGEELREIVRLAQILGRPVVLKGEPGCGKTQLARAVAFEWYGAGYRSKYFEWNIKSGSKAAEGIYSFDHIERLRRANLARAGGAGEARPSEETDAELEKNYLRLGPLAHAFLTSEKGSPSILLIDEIDKADIDFPNDLLLELDEARSVIREGGFEKTVAAPPDARPVVFITSNNERELPQAFLRRCLFFYIDFPEDRLRAILKAHMPALFDLKNDAPTGSKSGSEVVDRAIEQFKNLRKSVKEDPSVTKMPSTSELIDWVAALHFHLRFDAGFFEKIADDKLHFFQALLKSQNDITRERDRNKTLPDRDKKALPEIPKP